MWIRAHVVARLLRVPILRIDATVRVDEDGERSLAGAEALMAEVARALEPRLEGTARRRSVSGRR